MKKWQKVLIGVIIVLAVLAGGGYGVFKFYIQPKYIDTAIDQVSNILQNEAVQSEVDKFVAELQAEGYLSEEQVDQYMKAVEDLGLNRAAQETADPKQEQEPPMGSEEGKDSKNTKAVQKDKKNNTSGSDPEYITGDGNIQTSAPQEKDASSPVNTEKPKKNTSQSKTDRVLSALTASELSFVNSIQSKIDIGTATSLMNSDQKKFKEYIKSHLSGDEISRCLNLYAKYAYLLAD